MSTFWPQLSGVANLPVNQQGQQARTIRKRLVSQTRRRQPKTVYKLKPPTVTN